MTQTAPPSITPSPSTPDRADRTTFSSRATALADWLKIHAVSEIAAVATNVYNNAIDAYNSATDALGSKTAAANSATSAANSATVASVIAGASAWVNGNTYGLNACAISQVTFQTYRKKTASSVTIIDPALDNVQWVLLGASPAVSAIDATYSNYGAL